MNFPAFIALGKIKLALAILQLNMLWNRAKDHEVIFRSAWALSQRLGFLFGAFSSVGNPRGYEVHHVVYLRLLRLLDRIKPGYLPNVTVIDEDTLTDIACSSQPTIIVTIHAPVDAVFSRILQERGIEARALAANHVTVAEKARILGHEGAPQFISSSQNTLLQIRRELRRNRAVHLCIDYKDNASGTEKLFISSAIFRLAGIMPVNIVFSDTDITRDGHINLHLKAHDLSKTPGPDDIARAYLRWLKTVRGHTRHWTITSTRLSSTAN